MTHILPGIWWAIYCQASGGPYIARHLVGHILPGTWWAIYCQAPGGPYIARHLVGHILPGTWWAIYCQAPGGPYIARHLVGQCQYNVTQRVKTRAVADLRLQGSLRSCNSDSKNHNSSRSENTGFIEKLQLRQ